MTVFSHESFKVSRCKFPNLSKREIENSAVRFDCRRFSFSSSFFILLFRLVLLNSFVLFSSSRATGKRVFGAACARRPSVWPTTGPRITSDIFSSYGRPGSRWNFLLSQLAAEAPVMNHITGTHEHQPGLNPLCSVLDWPFGNQHQTFTCSIPKSLDDHSR